MTTVQLVPDSRAFMKPLIRGLVDCGWVLTCLPSHGVLQMNRQRLVLQLTNGPQRFRLHVYKISTTGRSASHERRIEVTTTYAGGNLLPDVGYEDILLGYDPENRVYVGFDRRRLETGGTTHNASSFIDLSALKGASSSSTLLTVPRTSELFGVEYHVYFNQALAGEYLLQADSIHNGSPARPNLFSVPAAPRRLRALNVPAACATGDEVVLTPPTRASSPANVPTPAVEVMESGGTLDPNGTLSPQGLERILQRCQENGLLGESYVLRGEKDRLRRAGRSDLASKVEWVSSQNVAAGYDILSFEPDGTSRYVEVKSTQGTGYVFPMSHGEWESARRFGSRYVIGRVTDVRVDPTLVWFRDPVELERTGELIRDAKAFSVTVAP